MSLRKPSQITSPILKAILPMLALVLIAGCAPTVRHRTLPPSIRNVYLPMIRNRSSEPGFEEIFTIAAQEEFLADGRLNLVRAHEADAFIEVSILSLDVEPVNQDDNNFATVKQYVVQARFEILENIPGLPMIGEPRTFRVTHVFNDDPRTTYFNPEPEEKQVLAEGFARRLVMEVLTGQYEGYLPRPGETTREKPISMPDGSLSIE